MAVRREINDLKPKSYDALLNVLLSVLKERLAPDELGDVLREVGRKVAAGTRRVITNDSDLAARAEKAVEVLEGLGGAPRLKKEEGKIIIRSASCPFATAVKAPPEVCRVAETLVAQITGGRVRERCNKIDVPSRCLFEITEKRRR